MTCFHLGLKVTVNLAVFILSCLQQQQCSIHNLSQQHDLSSDVVSHKTLKDVASSNADMNWRLNEGIVFDFAVLLKSGKFFLYIECCEHCTCAVIIMRQVLQTPYSDYEYKRLVRINPDY